MELSDAEKLILTMLCEVHAHLGIAGELDPGFVRSALDSGNTWGLRWKYGALYDGNSRSDPPIVKEVAAILDMWSAIEDGYAALEQPGSGPKVPVRHHPATARSVIRSALQAAGSRHAYLELPGEHAFMRDEGARYDPEMADRVFAEAIALYRRTMGASADSA